VIRPRAILDKQSMWGTCVLPYIHNEPLLEVDYPEDIPAVEAALMRLQKPEEHATVQGVRHSV